MTTTRTSRSRRLAIQGFDLVEGGHQFFALLEWDVTELRRDLRRRRSAGGRASLYAFFLKAIATAIDSHPLFNTFIDYRKTTAFESVDLSLPIEVVVNGRRVNRQFTIVGVPHKTVDQITREIEVARTNAEGQSGFVGSPAAEAILAALPRWVARIVFRALAQNHRLVQRLSGSVFVTSVAPFSTTPGFVIPFVGGPKAVSVALGSVVKKPVVHQDQIEIREMASVTVAFNHDLVDGAPAARFLNAIRTLVERDYHTVD